MFDEPLPKQADLRKLTSRDVHFSVCLNAANLPRLASAFHDGQGVVQANLHLGVDEERIKFIQGAVSCEAKVVCQRCMEPVDIRFGSDVHLAIVSNEKSANELPDHMDALVVDFDQLVNLNDVVEDELLLCLPIVSYHEASKCSVDLKSESNAKQSLPLVTKENPFSVLEKLKTGK